MCRLTTHDNSSRKDIHRRSRSQCLGISGPGRSLRLLREGAHREQRDRTPAASGDEAKRAEQQLCRQARVFVARPQPKINGPAPRPHRRHS